MIKELLEKLKAKYPKYVEDNEAYVKLCKETDELFKEYFELSFPNREKGEENV